LQCEQKVSTQFKQTLRKAHMKLLPILRLAPILCFVALGAHAAPLVFYTYNVSEALPCTSANCSDNANIAVQGTITTDGLGTLDRRDIVVWDLTFTLTGQTPIRITQSNGGFATTGSPQIQATNSDLSLTLNTWSDGFAFSGNSANAGVSWLYSSPAQVIILGTSGNDQYSAQQQTNLPATLTATAVSAAEAPEPASLSLAFLATCAGLAAARCRHARKLQL
jgi:hypothetical protein